MGRITNGADIKTKGQIEDMISKQVTKCYVKILGVGPRETQVYIVKDMIIVRLKGRLLPIEEKLLEYDKGISIIKNVREIIHELTAGELCDIIRKITDHKVVSSHSDISTKTGEILKAYILDNDYEEELKKLQRGRLEK